MKKSVAFIAGLLVSVSAFAAPQGHQVCTNAEKGVKLVVATYAIAGDPSILTIDDQDYGFDIGAGEGVGQLSTLITPMCPCPPKLGFTVGQVKWDITQGDSNNFQSVDLTVIREDKSNTTLKMTCQPLNFQAGTEQDIDAQD